MGGCPCGDEGAHPIRMVGREQDPDVATPRVSDPVNRRDDPEGIKDLKGGLGAVVQGVPTTRVTAGAVAWAGHEDKLPLLDKVGEYPLPGVFVDEEAVP